MRPLTEHLNYDDEDIFEVEAILAMGHYELPSGSSTRLPSSRSTVAGEGVRACGREREPT